MPLTGNVPIFISSALDDGPADPDTSIQLIIALRLHDEAELKAAADGTSPRLTRDEVVTRFSPSLARVEAVLSWASSRGLMVSAISDDRTLLTFNTTVGEASEAFRVRPHMYRDGGFSIRSHSEPPLVPSSLAPSIQAIVGLTDVPLWTNNIVAKLDRADDGLETSDNGVPPYSPQDLRTAYDVNSVLANGYDGSGRVAAVTTWGQASQTSMNTYSSTYGLPTVTIQHVDTNGGSSCGANDIEWDLDVQMIHAMAPAAGLRVYCASASIPSLLSAVNRVISDNVADVISQSWGSCDKFIDSSTASAWETKLATASAQGQAFFTASGDGGSRECSRFDPQGGPRDFSISPSWPATAPHTTSVAGTRMTMSGGAYGSESTWNSCAPCGGSAYEASGGGPSLLYNKPAWQTAPAGATKRGSGDVSAVADPNTGVRVRSANTWWQVGGTSVSSPLVAGMWTDLVDRHGRLGNAGPELWQRLGDAGVLRDITTGNNGDFSAGVGYDYPTGLGSPRLAGLLEALVSLLPPGDLAAVGQEGQVSLAWTGSPEGVTGYRVYRGTSAGALSLHRTLGNVTSFVDAGLPASATYYYRVGAVNGTRESDPTATVSARTFGVPTAPLGLSGQTDGSRVQLAWSAPLSDGGAGVTGYRVYAADPPAANGPPRLVGGERFVLPMDSDDLNVPTSGSTADASGNARHGTLVGGVAATSGVHGDGLRFPGTTGARVTIPETSVAIPAGSVTMWVKPAGLGPVTGQNFLLVKQDPGVHTYFFLLLDPSNRVSYELDQNAGALASASALPMNEWTHLAVTWGPGGRAIYLNGVLDASSAQTSSVGAGYTQTMLGNSPNDVTTRGYNGSMDEVREYGVELTPAQIRTLAGFPYAAGPSDYTLLAETTARAAEDATLQLNVPRDYVVAAVNAYGVGERSAPTTATIASIPADAPRALTLAPDVRGGFALSWRPPAAPPSAILGYRLLRGTSFASLAPIADVGDVLSSSDRGLADATTYLYQVEALYASGAGNRSSVASAMTWSAPRDPPLSVVATRGTGPGEIRISWSPPPASGGAPLTGYTVLRQRADLPFEPIASLGLATSHVDTGLPANTTQVYAVRAVNEIGESASSPATSARTAAPPGPPTGLVATRGPGVGEIVLTWNAPAFTDGFAIASYAVYAASGGGAEQLVASAPAATHDHRGLLENTTYTYRVAAVTAVGEGARGAAAGAATFGRPYPPAMTAASGPGVGNITLTWARPPDGGLPITLYRIYAGDGPGAKALIGTKATPNFTESGITSTAPRYYEVTAENAVGEGPRSAEKNARAFPPPSPPRTLTTAIPPGQTLVRLSWLAPSNAASSGVYGYKLYRSVTGEDELLDTLLGGSGQTTYNDPDCPAPVTCGYYVTALGIVGESAASNRATAPGLAPIVASRGAASDESRQEARLVGHERAALQMDADDEDVPAAGLTKDGSLAQDHAQVVGATLAAGRHDTGYAFTSDDQLLSLPLAPLTSQMAAGTVMMWANLSATGGDQVLAHKAGLQDELKVWVDAGGALHFRTSEAGSKTLVSPAGLVRFGEWTHIAVTWGASGKRVIVDGDVVATVADPTGVGAQGLAMEFGHGMRGTLDEVRVHDAALPSGLIWSVALRPYAPMT